MAQARQHELVEALRVAGYAIARGVVGSESVARARAACPPVGPAGVRNVLERAPALRAIADAERVRQIATDVLGDAARLVRAILFDKAPEANWALGFHQDTTIAVAERIETSGFGPWSVKDGVHHVRPPAQALASMVTIRVHLDAADASSGALAVIPGTHASGLLDSAAIAAAVETGSAVSCDVEAGDAVVMRPLLLHGSPRATRAGARRRVVHLEFAAGALPGGLEWAEGNTMVQG